MNDTLTMPAVTVPATAAVASSRTQSAGYRPYIDGLRAVAVTLVVLFHSGVPWLTGGFIGVDVFFVISGYLIGGILYGEMSTGKFTFAGFYGRRIRRIAPALICVVGISTLFALVWLSGKELRDFSKFAIGTLLSVPNMVFLKSTNYFSSSADLNPLLMTWSLGVEEQFYIFFPLFLIPLMRVKRWALPAIAAVSILSFGMNVWLTYKSPAIAFYSLPPRAWELGVGVCLAIWQVSNPRDPFPRSKHSGRHKEFFAPVGVLLIIASAFLFDGNTAFPGVAAAIPVLGSLLIIAQSGRFNTAILGSRLVVFVGLVSYSWYLWHWPLLSFARVASDLPLSWSQGLLISLLSFALACISYRWVEQPFRHGWKQITPKQWIVGYVVVIGCSLACLSTLYIAKAFPARWADYVAQADAAVLESQSKCLSGYGQYELKVDSDCVSGGGKPTIALLGDSHASALRAGALAYAARHQMDLAEFTKSSCPLLAGVTRVMTNHPNHARECADFNRAVFKRLVESKNIQIVILSGYWEASIVERTEAQGYQSTDRQFAYTKQNGLMLLRDGLSGTLDELVRTGKKVIFVEDVPRFAFDPIKNVVTTGIPFRRMTAEVLGGLASTGDVSSFLVQADRDVLDVVRKVTDMAAKESVTLYSPVGQLCAGTTCRFKDGDKPFFIDSQHLSNAGAAHIANQWR